MLLYIYLDPFNNLLKPAYDPCACMESYPLQPNIWFHRPSDFDRAASVDYDFWLEATTDRYLVHCDNGAIGVVRLD